MFIIKNIPIIKETEVSTTEIKKEGDTISLPPNISLYNEKDPFTVSGDKDNPFGLKNEGIFTECPPNYKYDGLQGKCVPDPNSTLTLNKTKIETPFT